MADVTNTAELSARQARLFELLKKQQQRETAAASPATGYWLILTSA